MYIDARISNHSFIQVEKVDLRLVIKEEFLLIKNVKKAI